MLSNLEDETDLVVEHLQGRQDRRQPLVESDIDDGADHLAYLPDRAGASELVRDLSAGPGCRLGGRRRSRWRRSRGGGGIGGGAVKEVAGGGGARGRGGGW
ncbi:hypothetical protein MUK42_36641 [Musa troglodytarum]|uniref:Uncharacterized protein n=1 Tax=Musa troglodytarum TaxID=320322 RepID=A0A9E7EGG6_9LILI|nr:hypothetical protein MUK42_36641 [Musa troglodytarum]